MSGTPQDGVWRSPRMSQLPSYGSYDVTVSAQDSDGDSTSSAHATTVDVEPKPVFADRSISPAVLDVEHTHVTLSGRISLFDPITGDTSPVAGKTLSVVAEYAYSAVTAADGSYAIDVAPKLNGVNATSVPVCGGVATRRQELRLQPARVQANGECDAVLAGSLIRPGQSRCFAITGQPGTEGAPGLRRR
ncbi:hypothetical protein [Streptomyces mirabilis]|uniref:hypothetical protein n=1 Tax=Streptomyces mirabilis TaxID=68239 RepID=UPI0033283670